MIPPRLPPETVLLAPSYTPEKPLLRCRVRHRPAHWCPRFGYRYHLEVLEPHKPRFITRCTSELSPLSDPCKTLPLNGPKNKKCSPAHDSIQQSKPENCRAPILCPALIADTFGQEKETGMNMTTTLAMTHNIFSLSSQFVSAAM